MAKLIADVGGDAGLDAPGTEGDQPESADPTTLARYISTIAQGIAVQAVGGAKRDELKKIVEMVLMTWPPVAAA